MSTLFSKIVAGEIPSHKILEDEHHLAFLDINPLRMGHTLVIPKKEEDYIFDLSDDELSELMIFAKKVAAMIKQTIPCKKVGMSVVGLEVAHAHVHLIPIDQVEDMNFSKSKLNPSQEELHATAQRILGNEV